jgi:hypothetical protein
MNESKSFGCNVRMRHSNYVSVLEASSFGSPRAVTSADVFASVSIDTISGAIAALNNAEILAFMWSHVHGSGVLAVCYVIYTLCGTNSAVVQIYSDYAQ